MFLLIFLLGFIVGLAWGAGGILLFNEKKKRHKQKFYQESKPVYMRRLRVLREDAFN